MENRVSKTGSHIGTVKFSQSQLQSLVQEEVQVALKSSQSKNQRLSEVIKKLECDFDYGRHIKKLESRVNMLTRRVDVAIATMVKQEKENATQSDSDSVIEIGAESENKRTESKGDGSSVVTLFSDIFQAMESSKDSLKRMREENEALVADTQVAKQPRLTSSDECPSPVNGTDKPIKVESDMQLIKPKTEPVEKGLDLPSIKSISSKEDCVYPPLPVTPFPSVINAEALHYNIPPQVSVQLALIRQPARLSVLWKVDDVEQEMPPMDSYRILMTLEKVKGSGVFWDWKILHEVKAIALPMCVLIAKYKPGHKVCVAVVGKDVYGRFGPYSEVVNAVIPESLE